MKRTIIRDCIKTAKEYLPNHNEPFLHYSFIIQNNKIIEWAINRTCHPPFGYPSHSKIHSEFSAYKKAKGILNKQKSWEIFNIRFNKKGEFRNSEPCECCEKFLKELGCSSVYYSVDEGIEKKSYVNIGIN